MRILAVLCAALWLASCGSDNDLDTSTTVGATATTTGGRRILGVNSYLWHATLDTLSFMPLKSADPFGGTIITDWYSEPSTPNERTLVTVYILDRRLRADGLKVTVFRQTRGPQGAWVDAQVNPETAVKLEDAILMRARELRLSSGGGAGS